MNMDSQQITDQLFKQIEEDLYMALEALEEHDIITIRQCADRVRSDAVELWQKSK